MDAITSLLLKVIIPIAIALVMFGLGLGVTIADFKRVLKYPKVTLIGLIAKAFLMPATGFGLAFAFGLPTPYAIGLVMTAAGPASVMANVFSRMVNANVALGLTFTAVDNLLGAAVLPAFTMFAAHIFAQRNESVALQILDSIRIFLLIAVPVGLGVLTRLKFPVAGAKGEKILQRFSLVLLASLVLLVLFKEWNNVVASVAVLGPPAILLSLIGLAYGMLMERWLGFERADAIAIAFALPMQGTAVVISVALAVFGGTEYAMPAGIYSLCMYPVGFLGVWLFSRRMRK